MYTLSTVVEIKHEVIDQVFILMLGDFAAEFQLPTLFQN